MVRFGGPYAWIIVLLVCIFGTLLCNRVYGVDISWKHDNIKVYNTSRVHLRNVTTSDYIVVSNLTVTANGPIFDEGGSFRLAVALNVSSYGNHYRISSRSQCMDTSIGQQQFLGLVQQAPVKLEYYIPYNTSFPTKLSDLFVLKAKKHFKTNATRSTVASFNLILDTQFAAWGLKVVGVDVRFLTTGSGCAPMRTIGVWSDKSQWIGGVVPSSSSNVTFSNSSGVIVLDSNVSVGSLYMNGGYIMAHDTGCPEGWSVQPGAAYKNKCYHLNLNKLSFGDAQNYCARSVSSDSRLVQISSYDELTVVQRICRGDAAAGSSSTSGYNVTQNPARAGGCWIGLSMSAATGQFEWLTQQYTTQPLADTVFRNWRRREANNHTFSEGQSTSGELCTILVPWQEDPLIVEEGSWNDVACKLLKPAVCQATFPTVRHKLSIRGSTVILNGAFEGGYLHVKGAAYIGSLSLFKSATLSLNTRNQQALIHDNIVLHDGSLLMINSSTIIRSGVLIGEAVASVSSYASEDLAISPSFQVFTDTASNTTFTSKGILPSVMLTQHGKIHMESVNCGAFTPHNLHGLSTLIPACSSTYNVSVNAAVSLQGKISVDESINVFMGQGADLYRGHVELKNDSSVLTIQGNAARMAAYDSFDLNIYHRSPVIDLYIDTTLTPTAKSVNYGVYRLAVSLNGVTKYTKCIPYHADANALAAILSNVTLIQQRGGITVRRYGDAEDPSFGYGYTYRIEMDAPSTSVFSAGPANIYLACQGPTSACKCGQTIVNLTDAYGVRRICPNGGRIAPYNPQGCVIPPNITVTRIDELAYTKMSGTGKLMINGGYHRLPPVVSSVTVECASGSAVVSADLITWDHLRSTNIGRFIFAGKGWVGWANAIDLFADASTEERGELSWLNAAPPFLMTLNTFYLSELGAVFTVCPKSRLLWDSGVWNGGMIGGRSTLYILDSITASGTGKALRYAMTMVVNDTANFYWTSGNISLANGANLTFFGNLSIDTEAHGFQEVYIGEAQLLGSYTEAGRSLLQQEPQLQWHGYFDDTLTAELRGGFYENPLCDGKCLHTNQLNLNGFGSINVTTDTVVTFSVPVNMFDEGTLNLHASAHVNLASGGLCDIHAIMNMGNNSVIELSGGNMLMGSTCKIVGSGELLISAGEHDMGFSIDAHITISGGYLIWPLDRGTDGLISFNGGLTIDNTGTLQVQPFSTSVAINNNKSVILRDNGVIQFPDIGTATEPSIFDESDAPDAFPSGRFTVEGIMYFEGGTLTGKAQYDIMTALFLSGATKYISSLSILQSYGHAEWSEGDIIAVKNANFISFGTLQMAHGAGQFSASMMNQDSDLSPLSFHSWDLGEGSLNYNQYIALRSVFVSKVPDGWTPQLQEQAVDAIY